MKYIKATVNDFIALVEIVTKFELDKSVSFDAVGKQVEKNIIKENKNNVITFLNDDAYVYFLCMKENEIIGYVFSSIDNEIYKGEGYINELYVLPQHRQQGIAIQLTQLAIDWLHANHCNTIDITVNKKNKAAIALYKKIGFTKFNDPYFPMRKTLQ